MFNNETRLYDYDDDVFNGDWYEDEDGLLYIIGKENAPDEMPDNAIADALLMVVCCDNCRPVDDRFLKAHGLSRIPMPIRRFDEKDGYYHA